MNQKGIIMNQEEMLFQLFRDCSNKMGRGPGPGHGNHRFHNPGQGRVLDLLNQRGLLSQKELMGLMGIRASSMSEVLKKLESRGEITKEKSKEDRRNIYIKITEKGQIMANHQKQSRAESSQRLFGVLSEEEQTMLYTLLTKLSNNWEGQEEQTARGHHYRGQGKNEAQ